MTAREKGAADAWETFVANHSRATVRVATVFANTFAATYAHAYAEARAEQSIAMQEQDQDDQDAESEKYCWDDDARRAYLQFEEENSDPLDKEVAREQRSSFAEAKVVKTASRIAACTTTKAADAAFVAAYAVIAKEQEDICEREKKPSVDS